MRAVLAFLLFAQFIFSQNKISLIDDFEEISSWSFIKSDGADIEISLAEGMKGKCIRIDYNFRYGTGYCGIQKPLKLKLPDNYRFYFYIRANSPDNNFEIKFLDASRQNVWWMNNRNFEFPTEWKKFFVRKRNIQFAWGPTEDKDFKQFDYIEFTIASFTGGSGTIFIDELYFEEIIDTASYQIEIFPKNLISIIDDNPRTKFISKKSNLDFVIDFGKLKEVGGLKIKWLDNFRKNLKIFASEDSLNWNEILNVEEIIKQNSIFQLKDIETRYLKFQINSKKPIKISDLKIYNYEFAESKNNIFFELNKTTLKKLLPRYFNREASYWTIVGVEADEKEALINSDGMIEVDKNSFSLIPLVQIGNKFFTYKNCAITQKLEEEYLPIPIVQWKSKDFVLHIKTFANGIPNKSTKLFIEYTLVSKSKNKSKGKFFVALLPFQVNPYYQFPNNPGGVSKIDSISTQKNLIKIDRNKLIFYPESKQSITFNFNQNDAISAISENNFIGSNSTKDENKLGTALLVFNFDFQKSDTLIYRFVYDYYSTIGNFEDEKDFNEFFKLEENKAINFWKSSLDKIKITASKDFQNLFAIVQSNLAYILINKDYSGIQPGSRSYERSWIRDGSLTSTALLRFGFNYEVKDFINWYAKHIYENGKVPCVVDKRGPDPVDEHDSHGEFIYLIHTYFKFTKDTSILKQHFPLIKKIVQFIDSLTQLRKTEYYQSDSLKMFYGLMPESISHEGYSAKPMHSYWDNFFTIRGLNDATDIAFILGEKDDYHEFKSIRDEFQKNLVNSLKRTIEHHKIDYIPGCVELGDFDPTSTSILIFPCNQKLFVPENELKNTFEKYFEFFVEREKKNDFVNFTPYEVRNVTSFLLLVEKEKAYRLLNFLLKYQIPKGWHHWAEVVWRDTSQPEFIGDMPHTWVGSDYINAFRTMIAFENELDSTLILLSGFQEFWLDENKLFKVKNLITHYGLLDLLVKKLNDKSFEVVLNGSIQYQPEEIRLINLLNKKPSKVLVNNIELDTFDEKEIRFKEFPATINIEY